MANTENPHPTPFKYPLVESGFVNIGLADNIFLFQERPELVVRATPPKYADNGLRGKFYREQYIKILKYWIS